MSLVDNLRAAGATVALAGELSQPFFSVKGQAINVSGGNVQVFEYADATAAQDDVARVSHDGSSIGSTMVSWMAPPHFYKKERLIVLYIGDDKSVISVLEKGTWAAVRGAAAQYQAPLRNRFTCSTIAVTCACST